MAEIKSTLDLVLERTKNLTMTPEERESLHRKELEGKVRGWVQKFVDGVLDRNVLESEMNKVESGLQEETRDILKAVLVEHIDPEGNNDRVLDVLENFPGVKNAPYRRALREFQKKLFDERARRMEKIREDLADRGISGSAVIPNLQRDVNWNALVERARSGFRKGLIPGS